MSIISLARKTVQELTPYMSARRIGGTGEVWINANEAPESGEYNLDSSKLNRYPEFQPPELIQAYASYAGVDDEQLLATRGADESIEVLIRTFCEPGIDNILICPPTYGMYSISAQTCGVGVKEVALDKQFDVDFDAVASSLDSVKIVFLCAPNNPTGNMLDINGLKNLLVKAKDKTLIVVDEAYIEFCPTETKAGLIGEFNNLVITRTLSKAFALAAIRCGFTLAQKPVIEMMKKVIAPYPVPAPVAQVATQALSQSGLQTMRSRVETLNANRQSLVKALSQLTIVTEIFPATGNFVLARFQDSTRVFNHLSDKGIIARDFASRPRLENCIRLTIGNQAEMQSTLSALNEL